MVSLGCPKNLVDSEVMLGLAQQAGHELTRDPAGAEVLVVNTCAFIDKAKQESVDAILEMAEFKKTGACKTLVVAGCLAERYRDELKAQIPEIDAILGTGDVPAIVEALGGPAAPSHRAVERAHPDSSQQRRGCRRETGQRSPYPAHSAHSARSAYSTCHPGSAYLSLRRRHAPAAGDAEALRLRQDRRGLRLQVRLLHHPEAARPLPQPAPRLDRP